jgi:HD-GYP domain-containing protein (c-di-GMP phosphodiesterase class II)
MIRGGVEPSAAAAVLNHHQHFDGSGFPKLTLKDGTTVGLKESRIHIFARILAVADLYDRVATPIAGSPRRSNLEVLHLMRTQYSAWCDPQVLKMLHLIAPPFPPGTFLTLSDGTAAVVVDVGLTDPHKPIVKRLLGSDLSLEEKRIDLSAPDSPHISHVGRIPVDAYMPSAAPLAA